MPTFDGVPPITSLEDLMDRKALAEYFGISEKTVDNWRFGRGHKQPIPWLRLANNIFFSRTQIVWWLNEYQRQPDAYHAERMRRIKEGIPIGNSGSKKSVRKDGSQ